VNWTRPADIKHQLQRLWDRQKLLAALIGENPLFPLRLSLKGPSSSELTDRFPDVREWIEALAQGDGKGYRIVWREIHHRVVGRNALPREVWIDSLEDALTLIGKRAESEIFEKIIAETRRRCPALLPWLERYPLKSLELADDWSRLLDILAWFSTRPRPGVYLRQIDIPGIHTKFIEGHRGVLAELLDLTLPPEAVRQEVTGVANFCLRYGLREKPPRIRFRMLDPQHALFPSSTDQDIMVNHDTFSDLDLPVQRIFITENEINFLAFPRVANSLVLFGSGYGFEMLAQAAWLHTREIQYWGDIDTHGFAILDQLRAHFNHVQSFLMDRDTLLAHRPHWVTEPTPQTRLLARLDVAENALYHDLQQDRLGYHVRLEQERIAFSWLQRALNTIE